MVFGGLLMVTLIFQILLLKEFPRNKWVWFSLLMVGIALILTQTRGAWIGFIVGFMVLTWKINRKWLFIGMAIVIALFFMLPRDLKERVQSIWNFKVSMNSSHQIDKTNNQRLFIWSAGLQIIKDYPWGIGQGNLEDLYPKYKSPNAPEPTQPHLHNNFLQILAQNGWLGLAAYLVWIFAYYFKAMSFKPLDLGLQSLNWAFLSIFTAVLVWGLTEYTFSHQFMNVQFFLLGLQCRLWSIASSPANNLST